MFPVLHKLAKAGIVEKADLDNVKNLAKEFKTCKKAQGKDACLGKLVEQVKAQIALFEKVTSKIEKPNLKAKAESAMAKLKEKLGKLEAKAGAAPAQATPPPATPAPETK